MRETIKESRKLLRALTLVALAAGGFSGCNNPSPTCNINGDQQGSFMATVTSFPVPVATDAAFTSAQVQSIQYAVQQWNAVGQQLIQGDFFSVQKGVDLESTPPDIGTCGQNLNGTDTTLYLLAETTQADWTTLEQNHSVPTASAVGVTFRCTIGNQAQRQVTALNVATIEPSQLSSVVLHELGHGLGLDHSCSSSGSSSGFGACAGLPDDHPYHLAVMFPSLQMPATGGSYVEIKDHVQSNDFNRAQCMYGN